jgi:hypothetical protein
MQREHPFVVYVVGKKLPHQIMSAHAFGRELPVGPTHHQELTSSLLQMPLNYVIILGYSHMVH